MPANFYQRFSSLCPVTQLLMVRLIQEEFTPLLCLPAGVAESAWTRAVALADPTFLYCATPQATISICPESYQRLQECLQRALTLAEPQSH
jgi:hypothetical protein